MTKFDNVMHNSAAHRIILNVPNTAWNRDGSRKIETHFVYDLETRGLNATEPIFGACIKMETGEEWVFSCMRSMREHFESYAPCVCWAHNGSKFDIFGILGKEECYESKKVLGGTTIYELELNGVLYRDSSHLLDLPLRKLAKSVEMEKGITPQGFIDGTITHFDQVTEEEKEYCLMDCRILVVALRRLHQIYASLVSKKPRDIELPLTIASLAYRVWCAVSWPEHWTWTDARKRERGMGIGKKVFNEIFRDAEVGGRVQVFAHPGETIYGGVHTFDANSLYASQMLNQFPDLTSISKVGPTFEALKVCLDHPDRVCAALVRVVRPDGVPPMLPGKDGDNRRDWNITEFEGWLCEPELKLMLEIGYVVEEVKDLISARAIRPFDRFVNVLYDLRMAMKAKGDPAEAIVKRILCSLFGRFGIKERPMRIEGGEAIKKAQERDDYLERFEKRYHDGLGLQWPYLLDHGSMNRSPASQWFGFSSFILSYGRAELMRGILAAGHDILYVDTDSCHVRVESAERFREAISIGDKLGQWKQETDEPIHAAKYWEPKCYVHFNDEGERTLVKHKGVRVRDDDGEFLPSAGDLTQEQISRTVVTLYEGLRRNLEPGTPLITAKRSRRFYREET